MRRKTVTTIEFGDGDIETDSGIRIAVRAGSEKKYYKIIVLRALSQENIHAISLHVYRPGDSTLTKRISREESDEIVGHLLNNLPEELSITCSRNGENHHIIDVEFQLCPKMSFCESAIFVTNEILQTFEVSLESRNIIVGNFGITTVTWVKPSKSCWMPFSQYIVLRHPTLIAIRKELFAAMLEKPDA